MLDYLGAQYVYMLEVTKDNPLLAPIITVSLIGGLTVLLRSAPRQLLRFLATQLTTGLTLHNAGHWGNRAIFVAFMSWYTGQSGSKWSRRYSLETRDNGPDNLAMGAGYGIHFFRFEGRLFWFRKSALESSGSESQKEMLEIFTYGRSRKPLDKLIDAFRPKPRAEGVTEIHSLTVHGWERQAELNHRPLESVIVEEAKLQKLLKSVDEFYSMRDWYLARGMAHKLCILLHGVPGCGKTSLVKALAAHFNVDIYKININQLTDSSLEAALARVPKGNIVLMEDFDSNSAVHARITDITDPMPAAPGQLPPLVISSGAAADTFVPLSLTGMLNAFDGVIPLDNTVVIFTTNHPEKIDPAVLRPGRTDMVLELGPLNDAEIKRYIRYAYGERDLSAYRFRPTAGCNIHSLLSEHKTDFEAFIADMHANYGASAQDNVAKIGSLK